MLKYKGFFWILSKEIGPLSPLNPDFFQFYDRNSNNVNTFFTFLCHIPSIFVLYILSATNKQTQFLENTRNDILWNVNRRTFDHHFYGSVIMKKIIIPMFHFLKEFVILKSHNIMDSSMISSDLSIFVTCMIL